MALPLTKHVHRAALLMERRRDPPRTAGMSGARPLIVLVAVVSGAAVPVAGCGGPTLMPTPNLYADTLEDPFADVPPVFRTNAVDVVYATDREPEGDPAKEPRYGSRRSMSLAFGVTVVRIGQDVSWEDLVAASRSARRRLSLRMGTLETREAGRFPPAPTKEVEREGQLVESPDSVAARLSAETRFKALMAERLALTPKREVYVFIHGTANDFQEPTYVMAGLWHFLGRRGVPVVYAWPAGGPDHPLLGYSYDSESSEFTVYHLKQFLRLMAECPGVEKVHILAHSRGTDTALTALRELNLEIRAAGGDTRTALKLGCFVLAAADMDLEVSTQRVSAERLLRVPEQTVLYGSPTDAALTLAALFFGSRDRLGRFGAGAPTPWRAELLQHVPSVQFIEASVSGSWFGSHEYFYSNPAVSSDLILLLRDNRRPGAEYGRPLTQRPDGLWQMDRDYPAPRPSRTGPGAEQE